MGAFALDGVSGHSTGLDPTLGEGALGFGRLFSEHMAVLDWDGENGWHNGRICAYEPLTISPAASVFHYGQAIFEGLKAYRQPHGGIALFRPFVNAARFNRSAIRITMPQLPEETFVEAIEMLVSVDSAWVPDGVGRSLYLRPFMIANEPSLGVRPSSRYLFSVIASPVDGFFSATVKPIKAWLSTDYVRAAPGGTGEAKFAGNYAGSMAAQLQAAEHDCEQVVWLDSNERSQIEEMGAMNIFLVEGSRLVTPPLMGTQLAGVTRDSIMVLAQSLGYEVSERPITVAQWRAASAAGTCTEAFACGTAAVITPIGEVRSSAASWTIGDGTAGEITSRLREHLLDIQYGIRPDTFGWMHKIG